MAPKRKQQSAESSAKRPRHRASFPALPVTDHPTRPQFLTPHKPKLRPYPLQPSDSPSNPFGRTRTQTLITSLPPPTKYARHITLRFQFVRRDVARDPTGVYRVVQVPLTYTFVHLRVLISFLFGVELDQAQRGTDDDHLFKVKNSVKLWRPETKGGYINSGKTWAKLSSTRDPFRWRDAAEDEEDVDVADADMAYDSCSSSSSSISSGSSPAQKRKRGTKPKHWEWHDEEEFTIDHAWPKGINLRHGIVYVHSPHVQVHITINQTHIAQRRGKGNTPHVFTARGRVYLHNDPPPLPSPTPSLSLSLSPKKRKTNHPIPSIFKSTTHKGIIFPKSHSTLQGLVFPKRTMTASASTTAAAAVTTNLPQARRASIFPKLSPTPGIFARLNRPTSLSASASPASAASTTSTSHTSSLSPAFPPTPPVKPTLTTTTISRTNTMTTNSSPSKRRRSASESPLTSASASATTNPPTDHQDRTSHSPVKRARTRMRSADELWWVLDAKFEQEQGAQEGLHREAWEQQDEEVGDAEQQEEDDEEAGLTDEDADGELEAEDEEERDELDPDVHPQGDEDEYEDDDEDQENHEMSDAHPFFLGGSTTSTTQGLARKRKRPEDEDEDERAYDDNEDRSFEDGEGDDDEEPEEEDQIDQLVSSSDDDNESTHQTGYDSSYSDFPDEEGENDPHQRSRKKENLKAHLPPRHWNYPEDRFAVYLGWFVAKWDSGLGVSRLFQDAGSKHGAQALVAGQTRLEANSEVKSGKKRFEALFVDDGDDTATYAVAEADADDTALPDTPSLTSASTSQSTYPIPSSPSSRPSHHPTPGHYASSPAFPPRTSSPDHTSSYYPSPVKRVRVLDPSFPSSSPPPATLESESFSSFSTHPPNPSFSSPSKHTANLFLHLPYAYAYKNTPAPHLAGAHRLRFERVERRLERAKRVMGEVEWGKLDEGGKEQKGEETDGDGEEEKEDETTRLRRIIHNSAHELEV
ncbi:hypothetical protein FA15DRAFT_697307 [Coprinopsis marcescibilis]|uniref:Uncharacterized protein n=1 Tax=Coprinopsis marcescibilis TaxID=230819 RepID=A0A5C3KI67_COPMA|nr:hypothetical protein FA15DRAFT_697307 [Coprinopsis marcescibilis]